MKLKNIAGLILISIYTLNIQAQNIVSENTCKPWAYWWWMGNAVTKEGIKKNIGDYARCGLGGLHIIPIYGVKGYENQFIPYLGEEWTEMLKYTLQVASENGMGIDITLGSGWPYGGPDVTFENSAEKFITHTIEIPGGKPFEFDIYHSDTLAGSKFACAVLYDERNPLKGKDITGEIGQNGFLKLPQEPGNRQLVLLFSAPTGQKVKRAAPGGEGLVIDYLKKDALSNYLEKFSKCLENLGPEGQNLRSFYNDSYETFRANWTDDFLEQFKKRCGYDFRPYIRILEKKDTLSEDERRIAADYYETISGLIRDEFTQPLAGWCNKTSHLFRDQAHGSPGNWLDLYALADIPETEYFGINKPDIPYYRVDEDYETERFGTPDPLMLKFASSAGNVAGKKLVSSESTTWLGNHFKVSLSQVKPVIDELFASGINHIFYHGITYSPPGESWPGWLFYASTNYNQQSHFWGDLPELNRYIAECQKLLQNSVGSNDILLYFPLADYWQTLSRIKQDPGLTIHSAEWALGTSFGTTAKKLSGLGYTFDYISDLQLHNCTVSAGNHEILTSHKSPYKLLIIPSCRYMPMQTIREIKKMAEEGAKIIFIGNLPSQVSGYFNPEENQKQFIENCNSLRSKVSVTRDENLATLAIPGVNREKSLSENGLNFIRKKIGNENLYFITNRNNRFHSGTITLCTAARSAEFFDPLRNRRGTVPVTRVATDSVRLYLQLEPGEAIFLRTSNQEQNVSPGWEYTIPSSGKIELKGNWKIDFTEGEPVKPGPVYTDKLISWTETGDSACQWFSGKAKYSLTFGIPDSLCGKPFLLDLGDVRESASVWLNKTFIGKAWCLPFRMTIPGGILKGKNILEVEVTNLSANRIRKMDIDGINWKKFYDVNFVDIRYRPFDASGWDPVSSGLLGPVFITPLSN